MKAIMRCKFIRLVCVVFLTFFCSTCFAVNQSFLNAHPSYKYVGTHTIENVRYDLFLDMNGKWVSSPDKDTKAVQTKMISTKADSASTYSSTTGIFVYKNRKPIKAKLGNANSYTDISPDALFTKELQELYDKLPDNSVAKPAATTSNTKSKETSQDKMFKSFIGWLGIFIVVGVVCFVVKLLKKGASKVKNESITIKNNLQSNIIPTIKDRANSNKYWSDLDKLLSTMNPDMQRMTIYIEMPRVCKSWFIGKEKISNNSDALQNCHKCARFLDKYSIDEKDKNQYDEETLELYAEALALVGVSYCKLNSTEDARYYCDRALKFLCPDMPNYKERVEVCQDILDNIK